MSGRLNEAVALSVQGELRVTPRVIKLLNCGLHVLMVIRNIRIFVNHFTVLCNILLPETLADILKTGPDS